MLTEKEKEMLAAPLPNRDSSLLGDLTIQDAMDILDIHTSNMKPINDTTVSVSLAEITTIIFDAFMLGYTRGKTADKQQNKEM